MKFHPNPLQKQIIKKTICIIMILFVSGCSRLAGYSECSRTGTLMGTFVQVKVSSRKFSREELQKTIEHAMDKARVLEDKFSLFKENSELNELNFKKKKKVSEDLFQLIKISKDIGLLTGGNFDITLAPVLKKEGFYSDMTPGIRDKIPKALDALGWDNVVLHPETGEVELARGAWIDLSGIAKGYIVDKISEFFIKNGVSDFLINAGGDIYACGKNKGRAWRIGIRRPCSEGFSGKDILEYVVLTLSVENMAVATSGDYENVVVQEGTLDERSHIIDPKLARSKPKMLSSMTVIAPTCAYADALATAMMVFDEKEALKLTDTLPEVEVIAVKNLNNHPEINFSKNAKKYVRSKNNYRNKP